MKKKKKKEEKKIAQKNNLGIIANIVCNDNKYIHIMLRYDTAELRETGGGAEMRTVEAAERNWSVSLCRVKTWPQLMCCALI